MRYLVHWVPTFIAGFILLIAGLLLDASIRRDERREAERRGGSVTSSGVKVRV